MRSDAITRNLLHIKQIQGSNQNLGAGEETRRQREMQALQTSLYFTKVDYATGKTRHRRYGDETEGKCENNDRYVQGERVERM